MFDKLNILPKDLGEHLLMRAATLADIDALAKFDGRIHGDDEQDEQRTIALVYDLMKGRNPNFPVGDFLLVEDTRSKKIVSSMNLFSHSWAYDGIAFSVGQPELVGTDEAYRGRGLIRAQFEAAHALSAARGHLMQGITGIPNFYRQYGYEMAVELEGYRLAYQTNIPQAGEPESYRLRPVRKQDLPFLIETWDHGQSRSLLTARHDEVEWQYELWGRDAQSCTRLEFRILERSADGQAVGMIGYVPFLTHRRVQLNIFELAAGTSWLAAVPVVMRYLWQKGKEMEQAEPHLCESLAFFLGEEHPAYLAAGSRLPYKRRTYAWYIRIPDLNAFLRRILPVLHQRIAESIFPDHSGDLKIGLYRGQGLLLHFERGRITAIEDWQHTPVRWPDAAFPEQTFIQLVTGYRTVEELENSYADCICNDTARVILNGLFPKRSSYIWPVT